VARIKDASVETVKAAASIVDVVSARTQLRKSGAGFMGRCPFHEERTPSFSVSPVKGTYHCFGCGAGGDTIRFVQETEQLDFVGAIESLAERYNITLEYEETSPQQDAQRRRRERLLELLGRATAFFEHYLWESSAGGLARDYLAGRGLGEAICREFRLGLSLGGTTLVRAARAQGFTLEELVAAGLANRRGNDYFPERLLFPLTDARGRILGFQARKLREDDPLRAKYVNSPESELFRKGHLLYGLHQARTAIAKADRAYVVEGNPDVLAVRQAGVEPVVASMGTALTDRQLKELGRLTRRLALCFDGDAAGETATLRGMQLAAEQGFDVRVVALPPGLDPADVAGSFEEHLAGAQSYVLYRVRLEVERAPDRQEAFVRAREILTGFEDTPERREALAFVADRLNLPKETQVGFVPHGRASARAGSVSPRLLLGAGERLERDALAGCIAHPNLLAVLSELHPEDFDHELHRQLRAHLLTPRDDPGPELVGLLAELDARIVSEGIDEETAEQLLLKLRERHLRRQIAGAGEEHLRELHYELEKVRNRFAQLA
jgi:DNA primase